MPSLLDLDKLLQQAQSIRNSVESVEIVELVTESTEEKREEQEQRLIVSPRLAFIRSVRHALWAGLLVLEPSLVEQIDKALEPQVVGELKVPESFDITVLQQIVESVDFRDFERANGIKL